MSLTFLGILSIICALLVTINKDKYKWLVTSLGFKNNPKVAIIFYSIMGLVLMLSGIVNFSFVSYIVLPAFVLCLSFITILIINSKKNDAC
ncbi:hypothetical protein GZ22_04075 [Terribacillus saccharophilus]|uniref:DUF3784 domain-containing protein n=1 Tax=Terribacillus saccharophilus TaxID=361277 RepID=A0A075LNA4_9BACI|nr:hypothetical protein GZ22_04075 [Terribacillus goriensis]